MAPPAPAVGTGPPRDLRGANQSLVFSSLCGAGAVGAEGSGAAGAEPVSAGPPYEEGAAGAASAPLPAPLRGLASTSLIGVRMTTGGIGREPGMLIRIRVVSVVSVLGDSGALCSPGGVASASPDGAPCAGDPYGGVPDG
ncbi:hypothetical protein ACFYWS_05350 [Streptomyces sp. NPDC002795]|uniref:hypothetical protein n=1 Tax=Streptomyces sp. NPDC002795 TaxID=3364665 RepID=UPI0036BEA152